MQKSAIPNVLQGWKKVFFYLLLMQFQVLNRSQVKIQFLFIVFSCLCELICDKCLSILQNEFFIIAIFKQK